VCLRATKGGAEFHAVPQVVAVAAAFGCKFWKNKNKGEGPFRSFGGREANNRRSPIRKATQLSRGAAPSGQELNYLHTFVLT
jgi:hypothetical protein